VKGSFGTFLVRAPLPSASGFSQKEAPRDTCVAAVQFL